MMFAKHTTRFFGAAIVLAMIAGLGCSNLPAAPGDLLGYIDCPDAPRTDYYESFFGEEMAVWNDKLIVSAQREWPTNPFGYPRAGCFYVVNASNGALIRRVNNPEPVNGSTLRWPSTLWVSQNELLTEPDAYGNLSPSVYCLYSLSGAQWILRPFQNGEFRLLTDNHVICAWSNSGARVYDRYTGILTQTLSNPDTSSTYAFGNGKYFVQLGAEVWVTHPSYSSETGRMYVFNVFSGALKRTIENPVPGTTHFPGNIYACNGNVLASWDEKVCLLDGQTGAVIRHFSEPNSSLSSTFGYDVAVDGATVYVTSLPHGHVPGNAWLYAFNSKTGALMGSVPNPNLVVESQFGTCVRAINGTVYVSDPSYKVWVPSIGRDEQIGRVYKYEGFVTSAGADDTWQVYE